MTAIWALPLDHTLMNRWSCYRHIFLRWHWLHGESCMPPTYWLPTALPNRHVAGFCTHTPMHGYMPNLEVFCTWRFSDLEFLTWSFSLGVSHLEFLRLGVSFPTWSFFQLEFIWLGISPTWGFFSNSKFLTIRVYLTCNFSDLEFVWLGVYLTCSFFSNSKFLQLRVSLTWSFFFFSNSEFLTLGIFPNWSFNNLEFLRLEFSTTWNFSRLEFLGVSLTFR